MKQTKTHLSGPLEAVQSLVAPPMARTVAPAKVPSAKFMARRAVEVPTGKLGIVIENRIDVGHEIVEVKEGSPLVSLLAEGDLVVSVNGVDTTTMSTAALTALMNRSSRSERTLVVLSAFERARPSAPLLLLPLPRQQLDQKQQTMHTR